MHLFPVHLSFKFLADLREQRRKFRSISISLPFIILNQHLPLSNQLLAELHIRLILPRLKQRRGIVIRPIRTLEVRHFLRILLRANFKLFYLTLWTFT